MLTGYPIYNRRKTLSFYSIKSYLRTFTHIILCSIEFIAATQFIRNKQRLVRASCVSCGTVLSIKIVTIRFSPYLSLSMFLPPPLPICLCVSFIVLFSFSVPRSSCNKRTHSKADGSWKQIYEFSGTFIFYNCSKEIFRALTYS